MNLKACKTAALAVALTATLGACGSKTLYAWNGYDYALLKHYKDSTSAEELAVSLKEIIEKTERKEGKVPPGLYADYAYALYEAGQADEALVYFNKEREAWPESAPFLTNVISRISDTSE